MDFGFLGLTQTSSIMTLCSITAIQASVKTLKIENCSQEEKVRISRSIQAIQASDITSAS